MSLEKSTKSKISQYMELTYEAGHPLSEEETPMELREARKEYIQMMLERLKDGMD